MMTISYEYEDCLYVNLTNRCDCACVFCLRHNGHKGSIYADDLWLDHEPTREEALDNLLTRDLELSSLTLQTEEVQDVRWASEEEVLSMLEAGTFIPYPESFLRFLFAMRLQFGFPTK